MASEKKVSVDDPAVDDAEPLTREEIARLRRGKHVFGELGVEAPRPVGRPRAENPKVAISLRVHAETLARFKARGKGWQTRMSEVLDKAAEDAES